MHFPWLLRPNRKAKRKHRAQSKATEFPLIHFYLEPHAWLCLFVPELGQNIHLPLPKKKQATVQNGWTFLSMFGSGPALALTPNQRVRSSSLLDQSLDRKISGLVKDLV